MLDFLEKMRIDVLKILVKEEDEERRGTLYLSGKGAIDMELWVWFSLPCLSGDKIGRFEFDLRLSRGEEDD